MATLPLQGTHSAVTSPAEPESQLSALLEGAGMVALDEIGWLRVAGEDRVRWLNGMTTNSIQELKPGQSNYNFFLSSQGRIQGDANALMLETCILLGTARSRLQALRELLDRFIIMDDVELSEHPSFGLLVAGPEAASTLAAIGIPAQGLSPLHFTATNEWRGRKVAVLHAHSPLVPRFELWAESAEIIALIVQALGEAGALPCTAASLEHLRILEGTPRYGVDIRDRELPQETNQSRALHFAKGCYLGQEIVERIRSRGNVHRVFHAFELVGDLPATGLPLEADGKPAGELTSIASIPLASGSVQLALGYIRREVLDRASRITHSGGEASPVATPFRGAERNT